MKITAKKIAELRELESKATKEPWKAWKSDGMLWIGDPQKYAVEFEDGWDAEFTACSRTAIPDLCDTVEELVFWLIEASKVVSSGGMKVSQWMPEIAEILSEYEGKGG